MLHHRSQWNMNSSNNRRRRKRNTCSVACVHAAHLLVAVAYPSSTSGGDLLCPPRSLLLFNSFVPSDGMLQNGKKSHASSQRVDIPSLLPRTMLAAQLRRALRLDALGGGSGGTLLSSGGSHSTSESSYSSTLSSSRHLCRRDRYGRLDPTLPRRLTTTELDVITHTAGVAISLSEVTSCVRGQRPHVPREAFAFLHQTWRFLLVPELRHAMVAAATHEHQEEEKMLKEQAAENEKAEREKESLLLSSPSSASASSLTSAGIGTGGGGGVRKQRPVSQPIIFVGEGLNDDVDADHMQHATNDCEEIEEVRLFNFWDSAAMPSSSSPSSSLSFSSSSTKFLPLHVTQSVHRLLTLVHPALIATASPTSRDRVLQALTAGCALPLSPTTAALALPHTPESFSPSDPTAWPLISAGAAHDNKRNNKKEKATAAISVKAEGGGSSDSSSTPAPQRVAQSLFAVSKMLELGRQAVDTSIAPTTNTVAVSSATSVTAVSDSTAAAVAPLQPLFLSSSSPSSDLLSPPASPPPATAFSLLVPPLPSPVLAAAMINCFVRRQQYAQAWTYFEDFLRTSVLGGRSVKYLIEVHGAQEAMTRVIVALYDIQMSSSSLSSSSDTLLSSSSSSQLQLAAGSSSPGNTGSSGSRGNGWSAPTFTSLVEAAVMILTEEAESEAVAVVALKQKEQQQHAATAAPEALLPPAVREQKGGEGETTITESTKKNEEEKIEMIDEQTVSILTVKRGGGNDPSLEIEGEGEHMQKIENTSKVRRKSKSKAKATPKALLEQHARHLQKQIASHAAFPPPPPPPPRPPPACVVTSTASAPIGRVVPPMSQQSRTLLPLPSPTTSASSLAQRSSLSSSPLTADDGVQQHALTTTCSSSTSSSLPPSSPALVLSALVHGVGCSSSNISSSSSSPHPRLFDASSSFSPSFSLPLATLLTAVAARNQDWLGVQRVVSRCLGGRYTESESESSLSFTAGSGEEQEENTSGSSIRGSPSASWLSEASTSLQVRFATELCSLSELQRSYYAYCLLRSTLEMATHSLASSSTSKNSFKNKKNENGNNTSIVSWESPPLSVSAALWSAAAVIQGSLRFAKRVKGIPLLPNSNNRTAANANKRGGDPHRGDDELSQLPPVLRSVLCEPTSPLHYFTPSPEKNHQDSEKTEGEKGRTIAAAAAASATFSPSSSDPFTRLLAAAVDPSESNPHYLVARFLWQLVTNGSVRLALELTVTLINRADAELRYFPLCLIESLYLASRSRSNNNHKSIDDTNSSTPTSNGGTTKMLRDLYLRRKRLFGDDPNIEFRSVSSASATNNTQKKKKNNEQSTSPPSLMSVLSAASASASASASVPPSSSTSLARYSLQLPDGSFRVCAVMPGSRNDVMHSTWACTGSSTIITDPAQQPPSEQPPGHHHHQHHHLPTTSSSVAPASASAFASPKVRTKKGQTGTEGEECDDQEEMNWI